VREIRDAALGADERPATLADADAAPTSGHAAGVTGVEVFGAASTEVTHQVVGWIEVLHPIL
jgi:hypothetical protein